MSITPIEVVRAVDQAAARTAVKTEARLTARKAQAEKRAATITPRTADEGSASSSLPVWARTQATNALRHAGALHLFRREEFGVGPEAPTEGHLQAVNELVGRLRQQLITLTQRTAVAARAASAVPTTERLQELVRRKEHAHLWVQGIEKIWDFYFELFGQRQSRFGPWLLGADRIALDCYQNAYLGVGVAKTIPAPPPFSYMRTGFSPATYRRGIRLTKLGQQVNPFPLIELPYHRLVNPWTLGAVLHEVSHNLQNDLGIHKAVPRRIAGQLLEAGMGPPVAMIWTRWNRELFADVSGLLLGGPAIVASLFDVIGRSPQTVTAFQPRGPHPTPWIRALISIETLRRMGFPQEARRYRSLWLRLYPDPRGGTIPRRILETAEEATARVVDAVCFRPYAELGGKSLAETMRFGPKEQTMIEEAARRLAAGNDPGIVPTRFLIGAARFALDNRLARPGVIATHFYKELARR